MKRKDKTEKVLGGHVSAGRKKDEEEWSKVETDGMRQARKITVEDDRRRYCKARGRGKKRVR